jgi:hypothetical protein
MTLHEEILIGLLGLILALGAVIMFGDIGIRTNWKQRPRIRVALGMCIGVLGVIAVFFASR